MRIWKVALALAISLSLHGVRSQAQTVSGTPAGNVITQTNGVFVGGSPNAVTPNAVTPQNVNPNLSGSTTRPAVGQPGFSPAMPTPGATAINPQGIAPAIAPPRSVTTAIGQQGFGGAIGEQGSGTAIGQQGSGTAIGQQGVGTAIIPPTNGIVIGQPEPFSPPPVSTPSAIGFTTNMPGVLGPASTNAGTGLTGAAPRSAVAPSAPTMNRPAPTGHR